MASKRITELDSGGTADGTALWVPGAEVGASYKFSLQELHNGGWIFDPQSWVYVSASSFRITGLDVAYRFPKGTRIRLTQTTTKYFVVTNSVYSGGNTTVTITGGTDYTLANAAISNGQYSYDASPEGYPGRFTYTPIWTGFSVDPAAVTAAFDVLGNRCTVQLYVGMQGTSNATALTFTVPIECLSGGYFFGRAVDNGSPTTSPGLMVLPGGSSIVEAYRSTVGDSWTASGAKSIELEFFSYYI